MRINASWVIGALIPAIMTAQDGQDMKKVLERLDTLERQNHELLEELRSLRNEVNAAHDAPAAIADEKEQVQNARVEELQQTKVEASQRFPLSITGTALFNAFLNGEHSGGSEQPPLASLNASAPPGGLSFRQSIIGLKYDGGQTIFGARVSGFLNLDLWGGSSRSLNNLVRLATAAVQLDWKDQTITVGQEKPLISPRDPMSMAEVSVAPLAAAGNLWTWAPQARFEQRFTFGENMGIRAQTAIYQTQERSEYSTAVLQSSLQSSRPAWEGRVEFWRAFAHGARIEIAPGFHVSDTHVLGTSVASRIVSVDWLIRPWAAFDITGTYFRGRNFAGLGGLTNGFFLLPAGGVIPVHGDGGWVQLSYRASKRITLNAFSGRQTNRTADIDDGDIGRNLAFGANVITRIAPNVQVGLEALQLRTFYLNVGGRVQDHYDVSLAYLF